MQLVAVADIDGRNNHTPVQWEGAIRQSEVSVVSVRITASPLSTYSMTRNKYCIIGLE